MKALFPRLLVALLLLQALLPCADAGSVLCINFGSDGHVAVERVHCDRAVAYSGTESGDAETGSAAQESGDCVDIPVLRAVRENVSPPNASSLVSDVMVPSTAHSLLEALPRSSEAPVLDSAAPARGIRTSTHLRI